MGIFNFLKAKKPSPIGNLDEFLKQLYNGLYFGNPITRPENYKEFLEKSYMYNANVYSIIKKITNKAKKIPFVLYEVKNQKSFRRYISTKEINFKEAALEEVAVPELEKIIKQPNPETTWDELVEQHYVYSLILGNNYLYKVSRSNGEIIQLWTLPAQIMQIVTGDSFMEPVKGYKCDVYWADALIEKEKILHIKKFNPSYSTDGRHLYGLSPISNAASILTLDNNAINAHLHSFMNAGVRGILTPAGGTDRIEERFSTEQMQVLKEKYKQSQGIAKINDLMIVNGKLAYTPLGLSPVDLAIIESQKMTLKDLCNLYSVPAALMNSTEASTYNNVKELHKEMMYSAVLPELDTFYDKINQTLIQSWNISRNKNYYLHYDLQSIAELNEDMQTLINTLNSATFITANEKREATGYGAIDSDLANDIIIGGMPTSVLNEINSEGAKVYE
jgi:HK97 family phage portal protein